MCYRHLGTFVHRNLQVNNNWYYEISHSFHVKYANADPEQPSLSQ